MTLLSLPSFAVRDERQLLKCLGEEEKKFHMTKNTGPLYDLNQRLISEMIQIPHADLTDESYNIICKNSFSPAWKLLELSITKGKELFAVKNTNAIQKQITDGTIEDYIEGTREIFLNFMSQIQALAPSATCLQEEIPEIANFFNDIKYLQEDVDMKVIFQKRDAKIFLRLKDYPRAFERCQERIKKKLKSASKESAKKS